MQQPYQELIHTVFEYIPRGIDPATDPEAWSNSPEMKRLAEKWTAANADTSVWDAFCAFMVNVYGKSRVADVSTPDALHRCRQLMIDVSRHPDRAEKLVISWSIIAPYYEIYRSKADLVTDSGKPWLINQRSSYDIAPDWGDDADEVVKALFAYNYLTPFAGSIIIPDIALTYTGFGEVTLSKALFTDIII
ncbi:hypothetical protein SAMN05444266_101438 [Chitinophaga jiangningensis]|uniref:Uncharacterized protein n=1 Tax=Chitinophaga jiangningensis TaxID=1419482 RepID=A0A1M6W0P7_9BACT|nr:hypothetical protein [Chitinophaga jiangningensis]SHK87300.1 hypothetical protein SAMN05444266_101438 [Chitinophaga jiangningensis]